MQVLVGKHEGRKILGTSGRRWEDNAKMNLEEMGWRVMESIGLAQR